jgi:hypothetical protein
VKDNLERIHEATGNFHSPSLCLHKSDLRKQSLLEKSSPSVAVNEADAAVPLSPPGPSCCTLCKLYSLKVPPNGLGAIFAK